MLSTTTVYACAACGSEKLRLNGRTVGGRQRAKCRGCGRTRVLVPKPAAYSAEDRAQVLRAYQDRMSTRAIQRTFGVCYQTLMRWVGEKSRRPAGPGGHLVGERKGRRVGVGRDVGLRASQG